MNNPIREIIICFTISGVTVLRREVHCLYRFFSVKIDTYLAVLVRNGRGH